ncbi:MAG: DEAD/DEAH box helicase [Bacteroidales bacterium]|jgi:superfamily II DNA or RNA helicase|nr:DEAD/DEAH box helicase [Bacteroidales bacterium]
MSAKIKTNKLQRIAQPDAKVPYHRKPEHLTLETWQKALRRQFVTDKNFRIAKLDGHPVFSDYKVYNPETKNSYKVALRDNREGTDSMNFCTCMDFKTNRLGTCKHLEAVLRQVRANDRLNSMLREGYEPEYTSVYLHYGDSRNVKIRIGTDNAGSFGKLAEQYFDERFILRPEAYTQFECFLRQARAISDDFRCYDDALEYVLTMREHQRRTALMDERYPSGAVPENLLHTTLFPYQRQGVLFAAKTGRCLIADEMGLGKTIQAIGAAELLIREQHLRNILVICPTSLKYQWQSEIQKFTDSAVHVIEGAAHLRPAQYTREALYKIVSYHTASRDVEEINAAEFDLVILDEAQRIKNWKTKLAQGTKKIKSTYAVVLTGTPLENKLEDLYSIMQFVDPFKLGPFYRFLDEHQQKDSETGKITGYRRLREIGEKLSDVMIRRLKKEVLTQLPERMDKNLLVPMTQEQLNLYGEYEDTVARLVSKWRSHGFLSEPDRQRLLLALNCMRMVCDSTYILNQDYDRRYDTKIEELMNILDEWLSSSEEKAVIFSQWKRMTHLVSKELDFRGVPYEHLHGGVASDKRKALFDRFNNDPDCRVFLSTDAGSTGLNLQSASLLINLDLPWNPAVLEQRISRIHRMGQKNKVSVINFVAKHTIEHRMLFVLDFKSALAQGILDNGEDAIFMDKDKFSKFMETVENVTNGFDGEAEIGLSGEEEQEALEMSAATPDTMEIAPVGEQVAEKSPQAEMPQIEGDDDILAAEAEPSHREPVPQPVEAAAHPEPQDLLAGGLRFLNGLAQTLSSPEATEKLVSSIVERDEKTGHTYVKIPVDDQQTVANAIKLIGQLFKGLSAG